MCTQLRRSLEFPFSFRQITSNFCIKSENSISLRSKTKLEQCFVSRLIWFFMKLIFTYSELLKSTLAYLEPHRHSICYIGKGFDKITRASGKWVCVLTENSVWSMRYQTKLREGRQQTRTRLHMTESLNLISFHETPYFCLQKLLKTQVFNKSLAKINSLTDLRNLYCY